MLQPKLSPWRKFSDYLAETYGTTVYRVGVDAGFSCPNRDSRLSGGCAFCSGSGARAVYQSGEHGLERQIDDGIYFVKTRYDAEEFLLYFQAYSNTNAPVATLKSVYDAGLRRYPFLGMIISTRPDCIDSERADLIASYHVKNGGSLREVWVELGLQSVHDDTLAAIGRGHDASSFFKAREILRVRNIPTAAHIIFGLPGETKAMMLETVGRIAQLGVEGVKFHDLHVIRNTRLGRGMLSGELVLPSPFSYLETVADSLEILPPETIIMRLSCDSPISDRLFPKRQIEKTAFARDLSRLFGVRGSRQGSRFRP